ncbi:DUF4870 domain-containing protein [Flavobacterium psychrotolerans]|uniref:DUF4870 domain-containing protein n=1 Tax=Flavobacterium psychrotolerans TaxID=2169410 RepID=A0A2U1JLS2_9FLAO|nr:DUF4870 domain-containing protein [Flavobacterium psychrotolerans]PWA05924.1 DUF4870 domain-containing protein [Flavobacterium psychrotolerans]
MKTNSNNNTATLIHLSALSQYFIPFGNFIFPLLIWSSTKDKSENLDAQGKQVLNFQLSLFMYSLALGLIAIPIFIVTVLKNISIIEISNNDAFPIKNFNIEHINGIVIVAIIAVVLLLAIKIAEFFLILLASVKASNGEIYKYPFTIPFLK